MDAAASRSNEKRSTETTGTTETDEVWTDHRALIFDVNDRPPFFIAFLFALQVRLVDNNKFFRMD